MDVVVTGRHCEITDRYRSHVEEKLARLEKHDHRIMRVQVEVDCEPNPRQRDRAVRLANHILVNGQVRHCRVSSRAMITRMISFVPSRMRCTRRSRKKRSTG